MLKSIIIAAFSCAAIVAHADFKLAENGKALCKIALPDTPTVVEKTAAKELQNHLKLVTGADFQIAKASEIGDSERAVFVGDSPRARKIAGVSDPSKLGYDAIRLKIDENECVLLGHPKRGSLYAVYTLLEDFVGVRWWTDSETFVPRKSTLSVADADINYAPVFKRRQALYLGGFDGVFAARMKQNESTLTRMRFHIKGIPAEYGGCERLVLFTGRGSSFHSHYEILPPKDYFKKHPEWYSLVDGKRTYEGAQLCLTNAEMAKEYLKNVKDLLRKNPNATSIQVSQNDWHKNCECSECAKIDAENGSASGTNLMFANKIAEGIEGEFPNVFVDTFAYQYTRAAPLKVRPRHNVLVRLCSIECDFSKPLETSADTFVRDIKDWGRITKNLYIWDYVTMFHSYMLPFPNIEMLSPNIKFFAHNGAAGIFEQGDAFCTTGDFVRLRSWVLSHLMWNPELDGDALIDEFLDGYYGVEVGRIMREYLDTISAAGAKTKMRITCFMSKTNKWLDVKTLARAKLLMDEAEKKAAEVGGETLEKVRRERIPIDYVSLVYYYEYYTMAKKEGIEPPLPKDPVAVAKEMVEKWNKLGVETWREFTTNADFKEYQKRFVEDAEVQMKLVEIAAKNPKMTETGRRFGLGKIADYSWKQKVELRARIADDAAARYGVAALLPKVSECGKTVLTFTKEDFEKGGLFYGAKKLRVSVRVRAELVDGEKTVNGDAFNFQTFNRSWKTVLHKKTALSEISGSDYKTITMGEFDSSVDGANYNIYLREIENPLVARIFVDEIIFDSVE